LVQNLISQYYIYLILLNVYGLPHDNIIKISMWLILYYNIQDNNYLDNSTDEDLPNPYLIIV
jgi:hypothetical protein